MPATAQSNDVTSEIAIFARLIEADDGNLAPSLARYLLTRGFKEDDQERMLDLAARNQEGRLSRAEKQELHHYITAGHLLALLHSKARKSLKKTRANGGPHGRAPGRARAASRPALLRVLPSAPGDAVA